MKYLFFVIFFGLIGNSIQAQTDTDTVSTPKIIYKTNPLSFFESPQNITFGIETPIKNKYAFVQEIGGGFGRLDYYRNLWNVKGLSEVRRYFWDSFQHKNSSTKNKYLAVDLAYRYVQFDMDEWVGKNCDGWNCNSFERMQFTVRNYNLCAHLKYGKQIITPVKGFFLDYFVGLGYEFMIAQSPLSDYDDFRNWNIQPIYFKLTNGSQVQMSVTAGIRIGYGKPKN